MALPTVRQVVRSSSTRGDALTNNGFMYINFPQKCKAGNTIAIFFEYSSAVDTVSLFQGADDKSNTYTGVQGGQDGGNGQSCAAFYSINIAADVQQVKLKNISGGFYNFVQMTIVEMNDVTAIDVTNNNTGISATPDGGSLAVTQTADYLLFYSARTGAPSTTTSYTPVTHANITWRKVCSDLLDGTSLQAGVYNSTVAITPQITMGTSVDWVGVSLAFKTGTSGQPAPTSGIFINGVHHNNFLNPGTDPFNIEAPLIGTFGIIMHSGGPGAHTQMVSVSDTNSNTWIVNTPTLNDASETIAYAASMTPSGNLVVSVNVNDALGDATYMLYDVSGTAKSPFDNQVSSIGTQVGAGDLATVNITPSTPNGIIFGMVSHADGTDNGIVDSAMVFDSIFWDGEPVDGPTNGDENNGWAHIIPPDTTTRTFTWKHTAASVGVGAWESQAIAFKALIPIIHDERKRNNIALLDSRAGGRWPELNIKEWW